MLLARDYKLPVHVFDFNKVGAMLRVCEGKQEGTLICDRADELE